MTPEGEVKELVKKALKKRGVWYVMIVPSAYGRSTGISDFQILYKGKFIVVETKSRTDTKGPTANQLGYMKLVEENQGKAFVVKNEADVATLEAYLDTL